MSYLDRILDDGTDRQCWLAARRWVIGASDAQTLAKPESIDRYVAAKLAHGQFDGNEYTESGHRWEPMMLAWAGIEANKALIHAPGVTGFAATPDGITVLPSGALHGAECKAKHGKVVSGPSLQEWRQLAWQFVCVPEFVEIEFIWVELMDGEIRKGRAGQPASITVRPSHPMIRKLTPQILPIAEELLTRLQVARKYERSAA